MARINIDDELHADWRFKRLAKKLGDEDRAIGMLYRFWRIAQDYWVDAELMPFSEFEAEEFQPILESGLAEKREGGVYACGADERFAWYLQRCQAGRRGGRPKTETKPETEPDKPDGDSGSVPPNRDEIGTKPNAPAPATVTAPVTVQKTPQFAFLEIYAQYPHKVGKSEGLKLCKKLIKTPEDFEDLKLAVEIYAAYHARSLVPGEFRPHPKQFDTFVRDNRWRDCLEPGFGLPPEKTRDPPSPQISPARASLLKSRHPCKQAIKYEEGEPKAVPGKCMVHLSHEECLLEGRMEG